MSLLTFVFVCVFAIARSSDFFINGTFYDSINSPSAILSDKHFNVSARVVMADPPHGCGELKNPDSELQGSILWVTSDTGLVTCRLVERMQHAHQRGCVGLIFENKALGGGLGFTAYYINWYAERSDLQIPAVEIPKSSHLASLLKDSSNNITVIMKPGDNKVADTENAWTAYSVFLGVFALVCLVLATYKLKMFIDKHGVQHSVPQICLMLLIVSALFRIIMVVDPPYVRGIYPYFITAIFDLLQYPLVLSEALLLAFYWEDAMRSASVHSIPTLRKMKKPYYVSVAVLMILACITVLLRGANVLVNLVDVITIAVVLIYSFFITVFYSVESYMVLSRLYGSKSLNKNQGALHKMTLLLVGSAFAMLVYVICLFALISPPFALPKFIALRWILGSCVNVVSLLHTLAFQSPEDPRKSTEPASADTRRSGFEISEISTSEVTSSV